MPSLLAAILTVLLLGSSALAQGTREQQLQQDPTVRGSQLPSPTAQGNRPPETTDKDRQDPALSRAIMELWSAPTDLQGNPIASPDLASVPGSFRVVRETCDASSGTIVPEAKQAEAAACPPGSVRPAGP